MLADFFTRLVVRLQILTIDANLDRFSVSNLSRILRD